MVTLRNTDTGNNLKQVTNQEGYFTFSELPPGPYELNAASQGFSNYRESGIVLETGQTLRTEIKLQIGSVNEVIKVTADAAILNTDNGTVKGDVLTFNEIQDMPLNGRDFTELALIVPGVVTNAQGGAGGCLPGCRRGPPTSLRGCPPSANHRAAPHQIFRQHL